MQEYILSILQEMRVNERRAVTERTTVGRQQATTESPIADYKFLFICNLAGSHYFLL